MRSLMLVLLPLAFAELTSVWMARAPYAQLALPLHGSECPAIPTETGAYLDHWLPAKSLAWNYSQSAAAVGYDRAKRYLIAISNTNSRKSPEKLKATCKLVTPFSGRAPTW